MRSHLPGTSLSKQIEGSVVFHRLGIVVAEVTESVNAKADWTIHEAQGIADDLRRAAEDSERYMRSAEPVASMSGARAARALKSLRPLQEMVVRFEPRFRRFVEGEHGVLVQASTRETVEKFFGWIQERGAALGARVREFREEYRAALRDDAKHLEKLAEVWAPSLGDHLAAK